MKKIITADNTETFLNEVRGETYHSYTGAVEESLKKFVEPCKIRGLAKKGEVKILDVCFGLGYNSAVAVDIALQENSNCKIEIIGLEKDPEIVQKIKEVNPPIKFFKHYKKLVNSSFFKEGDVEAKLILGDAREEIKNLPDNYFDAIFFDPFSPKTSPEMWQENFFREIKRVMKEKAILATYSCARLGRDNMQKAGLIYDDGPKVSRRGPGTIAFKG